MDLIYMNSQRQDVGVMKDYTLDLAFGADENDIECKVTRSNHCCEVGFYLYLEGTEYGGIIDSIGVDTAVGVITYSGRTWHGILESKVVEPDPGEDYLTVSGEANTVLASLVSRIGLGALFTTSTVASGINVSRYKMNRYIGGYEGIRKMLKASGAKLQIAFKDGMVELSAVPLVDYSQDEQFDTDQIDFSIKKNSCPINHVVCLGKGELKEREVIHLYADKNGTVSHTQSITGLSEVTAVYDYPNAESSEELEQGGVDLLAEAWNSDEIHVNFSASDASYDIGDVVGAVELVTGVSVRSEITKKIVSIDKGNITISYEMGDKS